MALACKASSSYAASRHWTDAPGERRANIAGWSSAAATRGESSAGADGSLVLRSTSPEREPASVQHARPARMRRTTGRRPSGCGCKEGAHGLDRFTERDAGAALSGNVCIWDDRAKLSLGWGIYNRRESA